MRSTIAGAAALLLLAVAPLAADVPVTLRGSPSSMERQHRVARDHDLPFARTAAQVRALEEDGVLVRLVPNEDLTLLPSISHPVAHPVIREFVERTAAAYREACGERLVVTSLTRPSGRQPANAHALSVHPAGVAVDLRISQRAGCRQWLERSMLALERSGVLDITRERNPPHYHVALFPEPYLQYLEGAEGGPRGEPTPMEALDFTPMLMTLLPMEYPPGGRDGALREGSLDARGRERRARSPWAMLLGIPLALAATGWLRARGI